ncbi:hypothetical protein [Rhizobium sullae]|uniref:Uncharacterized protein n=1 Tax=Rhizobium sullae TaxID=50338 RepID=A0ABY5XMQ7_RHISU|nr:hypothetical protein [Rhizobium sullae]UWU15884.1 hypothetical protein N2599_07785 [Rhizobium sullae]
MVEVNQELMYELLKKMHQRIDYGVLARHEDRLERIENRLELRELAEAQARFEPHP